MRSYPLFIDGDWRASVSGNSLERTNPATGEIVSDDVREQTRQVMNNLKAILAEAGCSMDRVLKATVFITSMDDFVGVNEVYAEFFFGNYPARSCIEVSGLAKGAKVEIEAIALLPKS